MRDISGKRGVGERMILRVVNDIKDTSLAMRRGEGGVVVCSCLGRLRCKRLEAFHVSWYYHLNDGSRVCSSPRRLMRKPHGLVVSTFQDLSLHGKSYQPTAGLCSGHHCHCKGDSRACSEYNIAGGLDVASKMSAECCILQCMSGFKLARLLSCW